MAEAGNGKGAGATPDTLEAELALLRREAAAIAGTLARVGRLTAAEAAARAQHLSEDPEALTAQVGQVEQALAANLRRHPLVWIMGAVGLGALLALFLRHR